MSVERVDVVGSETAVMKQQIAGFLGELAEELGWAPDLDQARVRPELSRPEKPRKAAVFTPDQRDIRSLATPDERMRGELEQLRASVKHLGSEVTQLRAQMAHLRRLPAPPDAEDIDVAEAVADRVELAAAPPVAPTQTDSEVVSAAEATEPANHDESVESAVESTSDTTEPESTSPTEAVSDPAAGPADQQPSASPAATGAKTAVEDETESGLELFASEPAPDGNTEGTTGI